MIDTLQLNDGRSLGYAEFGDPGGKPVFFFHGTPGSRLFRPPDEITRKIGVRLITADRPGYGLSTFQPGRRILDWPADIAQLASHLGIHKFAVSGHSGGGPYVAACAYAIPERLTVAAVLSGAGPADSPGARRGMTSMNKFGVTVGPFLPWPLWHLLVWVLYHRRAGRPGCGYGPR